jgi:hypothetical protein
MKFLMFLLAISIAGCDDSDPDESRDEQSPDDHMKDVVSRTRDAGSERTPDTGHSSSPTPCLCTGKWEVVRKGSSAYCRLKDYQCTAFERNNGIPCIEPIKSCE